jgi:hypothetical protein
VRRAKPNTQGNLDGLCGLYAIVHFLRDLRDAEDRFIFGTYDDGSKPQAPDPEDRSRDAFWYVLDAAHRLQMLSPDYFLVGLPAGHLVRIFNELRRDLGLGFYAVHFSDLAKLGKNHTFRTIAECVLTDGRPNAVIVGWDDHYFLAREFSGRSLVVEDSAPQEFRRSSLSTIVIDEVRLSYSFALIKESSCLIKCLAERRS